METTSASAAVSNGQQLPQIPSQIPEQVDLLIALHLNLWPALTLAIKNGWGTSSPQIGADKRDWLAGAISDLFAQNQLRDVEDLEDVLEQVMNDEFEVLVDDDTIEEVAQGIWRGRQKILAGDVQEVTQLMAFWQEKKAKGGNAVFGVSEDVNGDEDDSDNDSDDGEGEWNGFSDSQNHNGNGDVDMDEAPALVDSRPSRTKPEPEVDEDGFTTVVSKKRR